MSKRKIKAYMLVKAKPGKEVCIWFALGIMSEIDFKDKIEEVNFIYGPYDFAVTLLAGTTREIEKTAFNIREILGKSESLDDTLTLLGYDPPFSAGQLNKLIIEQIGNHEIRELQIKEEDEEISFNEIREIIKKNQASMRQLFSKLCFFQEKKA